LSIKTSISPELEMTTDRRLLLQCLINFLSNAIKYTEKGGATITAEKKNGHVRIEVADTGIGIALDERENVFQAFERLESSLKVKAGGTGLGLYLTHKIVTDILKGTIGFDSQPGEGSRFWLEVPNLPESNTDKTS
jgi:signal transduction histidine kinase